MDFVLEQGPETGPGTNSLKIPRNDYTFIHLWE
jgi:hypothetical protein